jgi:K(+)-stimulated pyrophosphate-energized sodium pump
MILFSWYGSTPGLNRAERMPAGAGLGLREIELPGGALLKTPRRGFIDSLVTALKNGRATDDGPFIFDRLAFEAGAATVTPASIAELEQLAAVLDAFPEVAITVEGHTDNEGVEAANKKLSARRAQAVKSELVALGIPAARIATVGYGSSRPIAGNGTEEGRARNRRLRVAISKR